jgi:methionyl-tRNA synthetase
LQSLTWGGLKAGTRFNEPAPLFPRAEKDAIERMQNLENGNNASAVDAASGQSKEVAPAQAPASPSVSSTTSTDTATASGEEQLTPATHVSHNPERPTDTAKVHNVPEDIASARLKSEPGEAPKGAPLASEETKQNPNPAPQPSTAEPGSQSAGPGVAEPSASADYTSASSPTITIDDFIKVDLRVAQILVAERIPKADKLLRLEVDLGYEKRQILAGIAQYYEPEKLIGRKIVIVANLAPRKMRGLESNGMLLAASLPPDGSPVLAGFLEDVPLGARLK